MSTVHGPLLAIGPLSQRDAGIYQVVIIFLNIFLIININIIIIVIIIGNNIIIIIIKIIIFLPLVHFHRQRDVGIYQFQCFTFHTIKVEFFV